MLALLLFIGIVPAESNRSVDESTNASGGVSGAVIGPSLFRPRALPQAGGTNEADEEGTEASCSGTGGV